MRIIKPLNFIAHKKLVLRFNARWIFLFKNVIYGYNYLDFIEKHTKKMEVPNILSHHKYCSAILPNLIVFLTYSVSRLVIRGSDDDCMTLPLPIYPSSLQFLLE